MYDLAQSCVSELNELSTSKDTEMAHARADEILCEFLNDLGYSDVVKAYETIDKWFA